MLIKNGVIHTMDGPVIDRGYVWVEGSRIAGVGGMDALPPEEHFGPVVDVQEGHVLPGFLDIHCHLGMIGTAVGFEGEDVNEETAPCTPQLRGLDGVNPMDEAFAEARRAGVTCVVTGPGSANAIGGQMVALKTRGTIADQMTLRAPAAMKFALGENPKRIHGKGRQTVPMTRMATAALIREQLAKAQEYQYKQEKAELEERDKPDFDAGLEALIPVLAGRVPAHFHAHRADDIATAVRIAKEFGLKYVIIHGTEAHRIADLLAEDGTQVVTGPIFGDRSKPELANQRVDNTAILKKAGVSVAICTDHPENPQQYLPMGAALCAKQGIDPEEAMASITRDAAGIAGISDRVGTLEVGKDADIAVFRGHPLELSAAVEAVFIDGQRIK